MDRKVAVESLFHIFVVAVICVAIFYNSLANEFAFDDYLAIVNNKDVTTDFSNFAALWKNDIWGKDMRLIDSHRSYRPFLVVIFKLIHLWVGLNPFYYRAISIAFHIVASVAVYFLSFSIFMDSALSFGTSMLFASHPVHVESVAAVVNMAEAMSLIFYIGAYFTFLVCIRSSPSSSFIVHALKTALYLSIFLVCLGVSVLFKETGITLCGLIVAYCGTALLGDVGSVLIRSKSAKARELNSDRNPNPPSSVLKKKKVPSGDSSQPSIVTTISRTVASWASVHLVWVVAMFASLGLYSLMRIAVLDTSAAKEAIHALLSMNKERIGRISLSKAYLGDSQLIRKAENPYAFLKGQEKVLSLMYLHFRYLYQLLWPSQLCAEYAFDCIPKVSDASDPRAWYAIAMYSTLAFGILAAAVLLLLCGNGENFNRVRDNGLDATIKTSPATAEKHSEPKRGASGEAGDAQAGQEPPLQTKKKDGISNDDDHIQPDESKAANAATETEDLQQFWRGYWSIPNEAILVSITWLVVPFVPASGVFLRLGTLLAERLLYTPSVGYCMGLALVLRSVSKFVSVIVGRVVVFARSRIFISDETEEAKAKSEGRIRVQQGIRLSTLTMAIYWISVLTISALYGWKTTLQNPAWKNDETLFRHAVTVCPRSAKLQLQLAKVHINRQDFVPARKHVDNAKLIDPDFCDIGYQEALLQLLYHQDIPRALDVLVENLSCVFTNIEAYKLLMKIWDQQIEAAPRNHAVLDLHAQLAKKGRLHGLAARKYQAATLLAFENKDYINAVRYSMQAEAIIPAILNGVRDDDDEGKHNTSESGVDLDGISSVPSTAIVKGNAAVGDMLTRYGDSNDPNMASMMDLACYIYMFGGRIRSDINTMIDEGKLSLKSSFKSNKRVAADLQRGYELLMYATHPQCVILGANSVVVSNHAVHAIGTMSEVMMKNSQEYDIAAVVSGHPVQPGYLKRKDTAMDTGKGPTKKRKDRGADDEDEDDLKEAWEEDRDAAIEMYAQFCDHTWGALERMTRNALLGHTQGPEHSHQHVQGNLKQMADMRRNAVKLWETAGRLRFARGKYEKATFNFRQALRWGIWRPSAAHQEYNFSTPLPPRPTPQLREEGAACSTLLWLANSLVGNGSVLDSKEGLEETLGILEEATKCRQDNDNEEEAQMRSMAATQASRLKNFLLDA